MTRRRRRPVGCVRAQERPLQSSNRKTGAAMSYMRLLGFYTLPCGCSVGRYRNMSSGREVAYVEQKGGGCSTTRHRSNRTIRPASLSPELARAEQAHSLGDPYPARIGFVPAGAWFAP
jgi:hypothetical protein